jgi:methyl-accepting chemotaxis protein
MSTFSAQWLNPLEGMETDLEPMTSFCMPITGADGKPQGVICADVSISLLSTIISETKPTQNSYCALLDRDGSFIVHPMGMNMMDASVIRKANASVQKVADAMLGGETGYLPFEIHGNSYFVFFKPFERAYMPNRSMERLSWSVGVAILKEDIFGDFYQLFNYVLIIAVGGLMFMFVCTWLVIYLKLRPLKMLTEKVVRIADGHYYEAIPDTKSKDEIGSLQRNFIRMRRAVASQIGELEQLTDAIQQRSKELKSAYKQAQKADKMKTAFLHHMSDQMLLPAQTIDKDVEALRQIEGQAKWEETAKLVENIQKNGNTIARVLNHLLNQSEEDIRKEVEHD